MLGQTSNQCKQDKGYLSRLLSVGPRLRGFLWGLLLLRGSFLSSLLLNRLCDSLLCGGLFSGRGFLSSVLCGRLLR